MRPLFPFYGSKWNIARYYPAPLYDRVVEPFAGSAGYSLFYEVRHVTLLDADPIVVGVWDFLLRTTSADVLALPNIDEVGDSVDNYQLSDGARWLIGFWLNRGSASPKKSRTAYSARTDKAQLNWGQRAKERIASSLDALHALDWNVRLCSWDDLRTVDLLGIEPSTWFVDPPYVDKGKFYRIRFNQHPELGTWCRSLPGQTIVCEGVGADWLNFTPLGSFKSTKGKASEVVWFRNARGAFSDGA